jgi:hypothetical protein
LQSPVWLAGTAAWRWPACSPLSKRADQLPQGASRLPDAKRRSFSAVVAAAGGDPHLMLHPPLPFEKASPMRKADAYCNQGLLMGHETF